MPGLGHLGETLKDMGSDEEGTRSDGEPEYASKKKIPWHLKLKMEQHLKVQKELRRAKKNSSQVLN